MCQTQTPNTRNNESFVAYLSKLYTAVLTISFVVSLIGLFIWANDVYDYMPERMFWTVFLGILAGIILCAGFFFTIISIRKNLELMNTNIQKVYMALQENKNNQVDK